VRRGHTRIVWLVGCAVACGALCSPARAGLRAAVRDGNSYFAAQEYDRALESYRGAQMDDPENELLHYNAGAALYRQGKYEDALTELEKATYSRDIAQQAQTYYNIGNTLYRLGRLPEAILNYKKALELAPADEDAKYNIEFVQRKIKEQLDKNTQQSEQQQEQQQQSQQQQSEDQQQQQSEDQQQQQSQQQQAQQQQAQSGKEDDSEQDDTEADQQEQAQAAVEEREKEQKKKEAERLLESFADEEQKAQQKRREARSGQQPSVGKDW